MILLWFTVSVTNFDLRRTCIEKKASQNWGSKCSFRKHRTSDSYIRIKFFIWLFYYFILGISGEQFNINEWHSFDANENVWTSKLVPRPVENMKNLPILTFCVFYTSELTDGHALVFFEVQVRCYSCWVSAAATVANKLALHFFHHLWPRLLLTPLPDCSVEKAITWGLQRWSAQCSVWCIFPRLHIQHEKLSSDKMSNSSQKKIAFPAVIK